MSLIDAPLTEAEEDQFYGKTVTQSQWAEARARHFRAWDADDVAEAAYEMAPQIVEALDNGAFGKLASLFLEYRNATVERRCEYELLGKITTPVYVPPATDAQAEAYFERVTGARG